VLTGYYRRPTRAVRMPRSISKLAITTCGWKGRNAAAKRRISLYDAETHYISLHTHVSLEGCAPTFCDAICKLILSPSGLIFTHISSPPAREDSGGREGAEILAETDVWDLWGKLSPPGERVRSQPRHDSAKL
jgi:hypothetical protein